MVRFSSADEDCSLTHIIDNVEMCRSAFRFVNATKTRLTPYIAPCPHWEDGTISQEFALERVEELRLGKEKESTVANLLQRSFSTDFGNRSFFQNRHHCRFLAWYNEQLIGHLAIAFRAIQMGGQRVDIVGIGEVAVCRDFRRRGVGSALVAAALDEGRASEADFAALFGEKSIYARAGFVNACNRITLSEMEGARTGSIVRENNPHFMIKPLGDLAWDFDAPVDLAGFAF